ncbi:UNVERIFIED_CONTAM: hypothetical protein Slati_0029700 [Sesamum latifolium]|uniref:Uncharacterized protein n=1 Tax=Sesamum latifolium TaxID=2727402 RepID=A0AAW2Y747_9LAMI
MGSCAPGSDGGTFWTMCPYCYYVYEYDKVFEDCCLRCANEGCRRVLHAVAIGVPRPPEVVEKGHYRCAGFMPFVISDGNGQEIGDNLWVPFAPLGSASKGSDHNFDCNSEGLVIDISDDERATTEDAQTVEETGFQGHSNGKTKKTEGKIRHTETKDASSVKEVRMRRKKCVRLDSKKMMGEGSGSIAIRLIQHAVLANQCVQIRIAILWSLDLVAKRVMMLRVEWSSLRGMMMYWKTLKQADFRYTRVKQKKITKNELTSGTQFYASKSSFVSDSRSRLSMALVRCPGVFSRVSGKWKYASEMHIVWKLIL